jgi:polyisoprenyl-teichoic acid--peptidoglycan teichoic acid transferase
MKINFKPTTRQIVLGVISLVLFFGSLVAVSSLIANWCVTPLPGVAVNGCDGIAANPDPAQTGDDGAVPDLPTPESAPPEVELPPVWDGASRVNLLVMGLDSDTNLVPGGSTNPDRTGAPRSDTMIVLTVDPQTGTAGMVSIPRDLWVNIPGFGYSRINTAYQNGEANKLPGGGPALAMKTVEQVLGVPIQYYAQVEFWAFSKFIDDIGKIEVDVPKKIFIDPVGPGADDFMLSAGKHWLNGSRALAYVRNRHTADGDVDRSRRQQDVIFAIRSRVLDPKNFPFLVTNANYLYNDIQAGVHTNLTFEEMMRLGVLVKDIPPEKIKRGLIDNSMVTFGNVTLGGQNAQILKPIPDKIRELRDEIFATGGAISPLASGADALDLAKQEGATVGVLNATFTQGLAERTADYLRGLGINVVSTGSASEITGTTRVVDHRGRPYMLKYCQELFRLNSGSQIVSKYDPAAQADIEIVLGDDWAFNNPMP